MDGKDIQSDLHALKRLYCLLKKDGGEASNFGSNKIDAHARLLLKNLLDLATKRALKAHSEVISGQAEASGAFSPARLQQRDEAVSTERPAPPSRLSIAMEGDQSSDGREQSIHRVPSIGLKRCRICRRNTIKRIGSKGEDTFFYDAPSSNTYADQQQQQNNVENRQNNVENRERSDSNVNGDTDIPSDRMTVDISKMCDSKIETTSKPEEPDGLSQEVSKAIQQLESCISALRVGASSTQPQNLVSETESNVQTKCNAVLKQSTNDIIRSEPDSHIEVLDMIEESNDKSRLLAQKVNKIYVQNVNAIMEKIEPVNWIVSSNGCYMPNSIAIIPSETSYITPCWPSTSLASNMGNPYQSRIPVEDEESKPPFSLKNPKNNPPKVLTNKEATHPLLSSGFHGNESERRDKVGVRKDRHDTAAVRTSLQNQESDDTATNSYSSWSSQKTSSHDSNSEEYSMTDGSRQLAHVSSSKSSGSWDGSGSQYRSFSEEEVSSSEVTASSSSGNEGYSSSEEEPIPSHAKLKRSTSKKSGPSRIKKAYKKQSGILKRLKDKLAVVFHHHHHHYHHHHHHHKRGDDERSTRRNSSFNKHRGKAVDHKSLEEYGAKAVEKIGNSQIREKKRQQNNFHGLVGGLMRHVRHSKKSKKGIGTSHEKFGRKKTTMNKSHWWQLLQSHQRSKPRLKLGLGKKKARLKALPKIG